MCIYIYIYIHIYVYTHTHRERERENNTYNYTYAYAYLLISLSNITLKLSYTKQQLTDLYKITTVYYVIGFSRPAAPDPCKKATPERNGGKRFVF